MRKMKLIGILIMACLYLSGCGGRQGQQAGAQGRQDGQALGSQASASSAMGSTENAESQADAAGDGTGGNGAKARAGTGQSNADREASQKAAAQNAASKKASQKKAAQNGADKKAPQKDAEQLDVDKKASAGTGDGSKRNGGGTGDGSGTGNGGEVDRYNASFFDTDSSQVLSCTVYHGEERQEVDVSTARGKYLVQMLSNFMENPNYEFVQSTEDIRESIEERARMHTSHYYVSLQFKQEVTCSYPQMADQWTTSTCTESFDTAIVNVGLNALTLRTGSNYEIFTCLDPEVAAGFSKRCEEWEQIEDWDAAFARLEAEQAQLKAENAKIQVPAAGTGQEEALSFLGIDSGQIQACTVYHGESQQELDLSAGKGQEFIRRLSAFLLKKNYSDGPSGELKLILSEDPDLGTAAQENANDYYILLQFAQPWTFVLNGKPEGIVRFRDCDKLLIEVSEADKALRLMWHHPNMNKTFPFIGNIGVYEKKVYQNFLKMYEEWAALSYDS